MSRLYTVARLSPHIEQTPQGYLLCRDVAITRAGELLYAPHEVPEVRPGPDGKVRIRRTVDDIHDPATLASFEGQPVTMGHPAGFVGPHNWRQLSNGVTQNVRPGVGDDADKVLADLLITDLEAVEYVLRCKDEGRLPHVSCGYDAGFEELGGGVGRQKNIRGNHVALVSFGRAGGACAIRDEDGTARRIYDEALPEEDDVKEGMKARILAVLGRRSPGEAMTPEAISAVVDEALADEAVADAPPGVPPGAAAPAGAPPAGPAAAPAEAVPAWAEAILNAVLKLIEMQGGGAPAGDGAAAVPPAPVPGAEAVPAQPTPEEEKPTFDAATISRAEILAPGMKMEGDVRAKALATFAETDDGKAVLGMLLGGRALDAVSDEALDVMFVAAAEQVAARRRAAVADSGVRAPMQDAKPAGPLSAEKLTEIHRERRAAQKTAA